MDKIRVFLAADLNSFFTPQIEFLTHELEKQYPGAKWVNPDAVHVTLNFLGDIEKALVEQLILALKPLTQACRPFQLQIQGIGAFPDFSRPSVLWAGLGGQVNALIELKKGIDDCLQSFGIAPEARPFHPHITLGRLKNNPSVRARVSKPEDSLLNYSSPALFVLNRLVLFRSDLRKEGPIHTPLHDFQFSNFSPSK